MSYDLERFLKRLQKYSVDKVAELEGVTPRAVRKRKLKHVGRERFRWEKADPQLIDQIIHAVDDGWSAEEIGRTFGFDASVIRRRFPEKIWSREKSSQYYAHYSRAWAQIENPHLGVRLTGSENFEKEAE